MTVEVECFRRATDNGAWHIEIVAGDWAIAKATWDGQHWHATTLCTPLRASSLGHIIALVIGLQNMFRANKLQHPWEAP